MKPWIRVGAYLSILGMAFVLFGFRSYHYTVDEVASGRFTVETDAGSMSWSQSGSYETLTGASGQGRLYRNTDTANEAVVEARMRASDVANTGMGVICNHIDGNAFYLIWMQSSGTQIAIYTKNGGYNTIATASYTFSNDTFYNFKITSVDDGANKHIVAFIDGVSIVSATTAIQHGAGHGGIMAVVPAANTLDADWFAFNTVPSITSLDPNHGPKGGGTAVTITGADFGDAAAVTFIGAGAGTAYGFGSGTSVTITSPAGSSGLVAPVTYYFGTDGAEEYEGGGEDFFYDTDTPTISATFTSTPTWTGTFTPTISATFTDSPTPTSTWTETATPTHTFTITKTDTSTFTITKTDTRTITQTRTWSPTKTASGTITPTYTQTKTSTPTPFPGIYMMNVTPAYENGYMFFSNESPVRREIRNHVIGLYQSNNELFLSHRKWFRVSITHTTTWTQTKTNSRTATPHLTYTITQTRTPTPTWSPTRTWSPTPTISSTFTATPTDTPTYTDSPTSSETQTATPTP